MKLPFDIPEQKKIRVIINSDAKNEADDQFAIVHALLTPKFIIKGLIAAHFGEEKSRTSMLDSYREMQHLLSLMGWEGKVPVFKGAEHALPDERTPVPSEGARLIIEEAMRDDDRPLFVAFLGPLTDLASAYLMEPKIAERLTAVWIGGGAYPDGGREYNVGNDIHAANVVFQSPLPLWQVPFDVYITARVGIAELIHRVRPCGKIGDYLVRQMLELNDAWADVPHWPNGEMWALGDSPAVSLMIQPQPHDAEMRPAPRVDADMKYVHVQTDRLIRVYKRVDVRYMLEDFFAKLALAFG